MTKPTLGYQSRTAAVLALRRDGLLTHEIAHKIGISKKVVVALEASHARVLRNREATVGSVRMAKLTDYFDPKLVETLRPHASRRRMSVDLLIKRIVETVSTDAMVDAVMDDGGCDA